MNLRERVARNLRRLRQEKSVSQEELAHLAQVNRNYVGMLEREEYAASIDMLEKLALASTSTRSSFCAPIPDNAQTSPPACKKEDRPGYGNARRWHESVKLSTIYRIRGMTLFRVSRRNVAESSIAGSTG
jgi:transcriptional regulator with XRE-family HTH domain